MLWFIGLTGGGHIVWINKCTSGLCMSLRGTRWGKGLSHRYLYYLRYLTVHVLPGGWIEEKMPWSCCASLESFGSVWGTGNQPKRSYVVWRVHTRKSRKFCDQVVRLSRWSLTCVLGDRHVSWKHPIGKVQWTEYCVLRQRSCMD